MKKLQVILIGAMCLACPPAFAVPLEVSICNQSQVFLEITDKSEVLADAATGECLTINIRGAMWLLNFGMTRYLYDLSHLKNCARDGKVKLVASDQGKLYCDALDQQQPRGFPLEASKKIDLI